MILVCETSETEGAERPYASIKVTAERLRRWIALIDAMPYMEKLAGESIYCFEMFDYTPEFYEDAEFEGEHSGWFREEWSSVADVKGTIGRCEGTTLRVCKNAIQWTTSPKYAEGHVTVETPRLLRDELAESLKTMESSANV